MLTQFTVKIVSGNSSTSYFKSAIAAGDMTAFNASIVVDLGVYGKNGWFYHDHSSNSKVRRAMTPDVEPVLQHTTIGALARTIEEFDFVIHPGDFAYADDWYYNKSNILDESNVYEAIIEVCRISKSPVYLEEHSNHV